MADDTVLVRLRDGDVVLSDPADDLTGRTVQDKDGQELGSVDDLLVDAEERTVRFLVVSSGGFLRIGADESFLPIDSITRIEDDVVHVAPSRERVAGAPAYDPDLVDERSYYDDIYGYYGIMPWWMPGYTYPTPIGGRGGGSGTARPR